MWPFYKKELRFADIRLVAIFSTPVYEEFKTEPPEVIAAALLAKGFGKQEDLVIKDNGIYLSRQCWERISTYQVWLSEERQIIITRSKLKNRRNNAKKDSQKLLNEKLPTAKNVGEFSSIAYATTLAIKFGLDAGKIRIRNDRSSVAVYGMEACPTCGKRFTKTTKLGNLLARKIHHLFMLNIFVPLSAFKKSFKILSR